MDERLKCFFAYWFSGLVEGLEGLDPQARNSLLRACGRACAESYTARVFQEAWHETGDLHRFLARLAERFPAATYRAIDSQTIQVTYSTCGCDLVRLGLVRSPVPSTRSISRTCSGYIPCGSSPGPK